MCALMLVWRFSYLDTTQHKHTATQQQVSARLQTGASNQAVQLTTMWLALPQTAIQHTRLIGLRPKKSPLAQMAHAALPCCAQFPGPQP
jgi:hypothetical protein